MAFNITGYEIFEELRFIIELLAVEFIVAIPLSKKRDKFILCAIIGGAFCLLYSFFYFVLKELLNQYTGDYRGLIISAAIIGHYVMLTIVTSFYLIFIFKTSYSQALLYTIIGYCIQHISYIIFTQMIARTWFTAITDYLIVYVLEAVIGFAFLCLVLYFSFLKNFTNLEYISLGNRRKTYVSYIGILIVTIFLTFSGQYVYQNSGGGRIVENPNYIGAAISLLTCGVILFALHLLFVENQKQKENELVNQMLYEQGKQYEMKKESVETVKRLAHDMKHQIVALKSMQNDNNKILQEMENEIEQYDYHVQTGNDAINIIILDKIISSYSNGIRIEFDGDGNLLSFMETTDIYVLLGNAIDNAIEAIQRSETSNKRISLSIKSCKGVISILVSNYYDGNIRTENGNIKTRKKDDVLHGIGLKSIKRIVEKYNGSLGIETKNKIFTLKAIFIEK